MKILKIVLVLVVLLIAGVIGLVVFGLSQLDNIAKEAIERGGTYVMGVETTVDSVDIGFDGTFGMAGFKIANPEGYDARDRFLGLGSTGVALDPQSIQSDLITVPTVVLSDVQLNLLKEDGKANYDVILDNLKRFESGDSSDEAPPSEDTGPGFVINEIRVTNVEVYAALAPIGGDLTAVDVSLDEIVLTDVGDPSGVKMGELMNIIVKALLSAVANKAGDLPGGMGQELLGGLADLESLSAMGVGVISDGTQVIQGMSEEATKALEGAQDAGQKAVDDAKKTLDDATKGIGDLFGGGDGGL